MLIRRISIPAVSMRYYSFVDGRTANLRRARIVWLSILQPPLTRKGSIIASCPCHETVVHRSFPLIFIDAHRYQLVEKEKKREKKRNGTRLHVRFHVIVSIIFGFWCRVHVVRRQCRFRAIKLQQICLPVANIVCLKGRYSSNSFVTITILNVTFCMSTEISYFERISRD